MKVTEAAQHMTLEPPERHSRSFYHLPLFYFLSLPSVLLMTGLIATVGFLSFRNEAQLVDQLAARSLNEISLQVHHQLETHLAIPVQVNQGMADALSFDLLSLEERDRIAAYLRRQMQRFDSLASIALSTAPGNDLEIGRIENSLYLKRWSQTGATSHWQTDWQGTKIRPLPQDRRDRSWYWQGVQAGRLIWSEINASLGRPQRSIAAIQPMYGPQNQVLGVLSSRLDLDEISAFLTRLETHQSGQILIMRRDGGVVASSKKFQRWMEAASGLSEQISRDRVSRDQVSRDQVSRDRVSNSEAANWLLQVTQQINLQSDLGWMQPTQQRIFTLEGNQRQFVQIVPYRATPGLDWFIVVAVPETSLTPQVRAHTYRAVLLCIAALMAVLAVGWLKSRLLRRSIHQLSQSSLALSQGKWQPLHMQRSIAGIPLQITELEMLNASFQQVAEQLQEALTRARLAVEKSEEKFEKVFRACPDAIGIIDSQGCYIDVNHAFVHLFGYSRAEALGHRAAALKQWINPADQQRFVALLQADEPIRNLEFTIQTQAGQRLTVLFSAASIELEGRPHVLGIARDITDRQQTEAALHRSNTRLQSLATAAPVNIYSWVQHRDGTIEVEYVNRVIEEFYEMSLEQFLTQPEQTIVGQMHPDDRLGYFDNIDRSAATLDRFKYEWRSISLAGTLRWLQAYFQPERRDNGDICWHGVILDISDRKHTEEALRQSEQLFRGAFATSAIGMSIRSPEGRFLQVNQALCQMLGYSEAELLQLTYRDITHAEDLEVNLPNTLHKLLAGEIPYYHLEKRFLHRQGHFVWGLVSISLVRDLQQQPLYLVAQVQDITHRKQAEEALQCSEARFQKIAAASPAQIYILTYYPDCDAMRFEYISPGSQEIQELTPEEIMNDPTLTYQQVHPEDRRAYNQATQHSFKTLEPFTHEWRIVTPSGKVKWVQASSRPERRENGEVAWYGVLLDITDRKQVEEALRQSEATKNRMLRAMPDLLIWMTAEGTYIDFIEGSEINCFLSRAETVGKSLFEVLPAELAQQRMDAAQRALRTGEVQVYEQQFTLQGEIRYEEVRMVAIGDDKLLTIVRDVTDRKRAEAELEAQQVFLRQLIDVIPNPVFVKDAEGRFVVANRALAAIHHCTVDEILGKREPEFNPNISWAQMDQYLQSNREVMTTRRPKQNPPHLLKMVNGQQRWFQTLLSPFIDAENQVQGVVGNSVDVTDLKQVEEALQRQNQALQEGEERFRSAFRDAPIGMALIHLDDRWLRVNAVLCDMLGYSEAELLLINVSALVHPEDINKLQDCIEQVFATENRSAQVELRYCCCGGQIIWGMMSLSLVRNDQQQPLYYVAQIQDITEQHAIDRMKNEFISIVSHELRTPLTAIRGFLGLLNTGIYDARPEKAKRMIEQSLVNSDRLVRLVNDILDLERLSSGKVQLVMEVCEVQALMQRAVEGVQSIADGALVTLSFVPTAAQVWAAPDAIIQTLTNLLSNAIKFSPPEAIVTLAAQAQADSILFQVRDRGRGIPAEKLGAIFGRFQQVDVSDARQKGGTGLGLAICQSIVQQHGGSIWVESVLGEGSTFYFTLPVPPENQQ